MEWGDLNSAVNDAINSRIEGICTSLASQRNTIEQIIQAIQIIEEKVRNNKPEKHKLTIDLNEDTSSKIIDNRPQTTKVQVPRKSFGTPERPSTTDSKLKKQNEEKLKKEEAKKAADEAKKIAEEAKKRKFEEAKKKKEEEEMKKKAAFAKKKEEEAKKKAEEAKEKKLKEEAKAKQIADKKALLDEEKKKIEESKKKSEELKKHAEESKKKPAESKSKAEEEKKKKIDIKLKPEIIRTHRNTIEKDSNIQENHEIFNTNGHNSPPSVNPFDPRRSVVIDHQEEAKITRRSCTIDESSKRRSSLYPIEIDAQIAQLQALHSMEDLTTEKKFELSVGAKSALSLLTTMDDDKFYLDRYPSPDVVWAFRVFFQLLNLAVPEDDNEAWNYCREFLIAARNKDSNKKSIDRVFIEKVNEFDFSEDNIDVIENMIIGNDSKLNPQYFTDFCPLTGLLMFAIREAALYGGAIKGKTPAWRQYRRLLHKKQKSEQIKE
ncbi:unnamed protein product [Blepharisma stoltei]|uniref:Uncharacterized protein n=1 Tax=Blepharisma stoltei TaxID=1481888 RepID=A0AAU9J7C3_9CILI|nr:unnamed protein product [Blepharisma stoltei]